MLRTNYHHIIANGASERIISQLSNVLDMMATNQQKEVTAQAVGRITGIFNNSIMELTIKAYVGYTIYHATGSIGIMTMTILYSKQIRDVIDELFSSWIDRNTLVDNLSKFELFLSMTNASASSRTETIELPLREITLDHVTFQYPKVIEAELRFIDIEIKRIESYKHKESWRLDELHMLQEAKAESESPNPVILRDI